MSKDDWTRQFNGISEEDLRDEVKNPMHYTVGGYEALDVIKAKLSPEEYRGYCKGNILKYIMRSNYKGHHDTDCDKAQYYAQELSNALETKEVKGSVSWRDAKQVRTDSGDEPPF